MTDEHNKAYESNVFNTLEMLKISCERDEARFAATMTKIELASTNNNKNVTYVTYKDTNDYNVGHLIFEEYTTEVDKISRTAIHQTQQEPFVCEGQAYINNQPIKVLVFREKDPQVSS